MERLDGTVRRALSSAGVPDAGALAELTRAWPEAVGPGIARVAWPQRLARDGTLHVTTDSAVWAFELGRMQEQLLAKLRALVGDTTPPTLRFAVGPLPSPGPEVTQGPPPIEPTPEESAAAAALSASIEDAELREAVRKAAAASLARARSGRAV